MIRIAMAVVLAQMVSACVTYPAPPVMRAEPVLAANYIQSVDGALLGLRSWQAETPRAIILGVHGMNDYSRMYDGAGAWWARSASITTYAIDLRGFGNSPGFGQWVGDETMVADLRAALGAVRARHPDLPVYVMGHSMGAGLVIAAEAEETLGADGIILAAPGIWGGGAMPFPLRLSANIAASIAPSNTVTGENADRQATDNIAILRQMYRDPLVIKETRLDAVLGVVRLMGRAYDNADGVNTETLFLIGEKDEIIPVKKQAKTASRLGGKTTIIRYPDGWHMLLRDRQAETVWRDVANWIEHKNTLAQG